MAEPVFAGIDLGTTFSVIAIVDAKGQLVAIPNAEGELTTPSVVHVNPDGGFVVGRPALAFSRDTMRAFKRFMGHADTSFTLANRAYTPEQLSAEVLRKLARDASAHLRAPIEHVVISVPAYFAHKEREATREAAGLNVIQIINEPTAAASVYARSRRLEEGHLLVFDLGGGTFDVTLLEVTATGPRVKRTSGSLNLGGQDFTDGIVQSLIERYRAAYQIALEGDALIELNHRVEAAKIALSAATSTDIVVSSPGGPQMPVTLTREEFEQSIESFLFQIEVIIQALLDKADLTPADIRKVLLVGGSSRIPRVRRLLHEMFGQPPDESLNADLAVAWGAALAATPGRIIQIPDSVSHTVGVKAVQRGMDQYVLDPVLKEGFPVETWSDPRFYQPERANDALIGVEIFQGDTVEISGCTRIGYLPIPLPPGSGPGTQIRVWMRLNRSGLLEVQVAINDEPPHSAQFQI
jgi:molecular chaperone DnaK (HSP70)